MQIQNNVFIITGGASGLGAATARMIVANGGKVVLADVQAESGEKLAAELGGKFVKCDVTSEVDGNAVVDAAVAIGAIRGLINCAGVAPAVKTLGKDGAHPGRAQTHGLFDDLPARAPGDAAPDEARDREELPEDLT